MADLADEVLDQWDTVEDLEELSDILVDAMDVAYDGGALLDGSGVPVHVVPCVPGQVIPPNARVSGVKMARIDGVIGLYLFAEPA